MHPRPTTMEADPMDWTDRRTAVEELASAHGRRVFHAAYRVLGDAALAEDVQQNVFLGLFESPPGDVKSWPAYLTTVATRKAVDELRRRARWTRLTPGWLEALVEPSAEPEALTATEQRQRDLRRALGTIRSREAGCFAMRYFQGMDLAEIARALSMTENHVSVTLHRAVKALRARLTPDNALQEENRS